MFYIKNRIRIDVYADNYTKKHLLSAFGYCFKNKSEYPPILKLNNLKQTHRFKFKNKKIEFKSIKVQHGRINSIGYIINNKCGYVSDVSKIYDHDLKKLKNLKYVEKIKPKKTILTNLNSEMDYSTLKRKLPKHIIPAYDGLSFIL